MSKSKRNMLIKGYYYWFLAFKPKVDKWSIPNSWESEL